MSSLNKVILIGRVGKKPELRMTPSGTAVASFSLATSEQWRDKDNQKKEDTQWHDVTVWAKQAEIVEKYVEKGHLLYIEGSLKTDSYEKEGTKFYRTKIVARDFKFLTPKSESAPQTAQHTQWQSHSKSGQPQEYPQPSHSQKSTLQADEIPF